MQLQAERSKPNARKAVVHNVERGLLLGDEQHAPSEREVVRDEVCDRLRLSGAGRTMQHERLAQRRVEDGRELRRVRAHRAAQMRIVEMAVHLLRREDLHSVVERSGPVDQVGDERMRADSLAARSEILPHHELAEGELPEDALLRHREARQIAHGRAEDAEHLRHVHTGVVGRQRIESRHRKLVLHAQHLEERGVDDRLLVDPVYAVAFRHAAPLYPHRHQQNRRAVRRSRLGATGLSPFKSAKREEQSVDAALLKVNPRRPVELLHPLVGLALRQRAPQVALAKRLHESVAVLLKRRGGRKALEGASRLLV